MGFIKYLWKVLSVAFSGAWAVLGAASTILPIFSGIVIYKYPRTESCMNQLAWIIPLILFFAFWVINLALIAPYRIYKKQKQENDELQKTLKRQKDVLREKLKQRLVPIVTEINDLIQDIESNAIAISILADMSALYLAQKWLNDAGISQVIQSMYFRRYCSCFPLRFVLARDCYVLLYIEDWIKGKRISNPLRDAKKRINASLQKMESETGIPITIKAVPSVMDVHNEKLVVEKRAEILFKEYSLEEALANSNDEVLDPTDIVERTKESLKNVKNYLKDKL
jgi:hypothetical protein